MSTPAHALWYRELMLGIPFKEHIGGIQYPSPSKSVITGWWLCNFKHHNATATEVLPKAYSKVHQSIWMAEVSTDLWLKVWSPFASVLEPPFLVGGCRYGPCSMHLSNPTCPDVDESKPPNWTNHHTLPWWARMVGNPLFLHPTIIFLQRLLLGEFPGSKAGVSGCR